MLPAADAQLRRTGECGRWRRTTEELDEAPQVLSGCGQQHLIRPRSAPTLECSDVRLGWQETRKRVLELRRPVTVSRDIRSFGRTVSTLNAAVAPCGRAGRRDRRRRSPFFDVIPLKCCVRAGCAQAPRMRPWLVRNRRGMARVIRPSTIFQPNGGSYGKVRNVRK